MGRLQSTVRALSCSPASTKFKQTNNNTISMAMSKVKQNFHTDNEALINKQINMELYASYVYLSMSAYFAHDNIALHGFSKRFLDASNEEREHAQKLIEYQTKRGGRVVFREIAKPSVDEWGTALEAIEATLELERTVNEALLTLHKTAGDHDDGQLTDFLEGNYLEEQVEAIKEIADLITKMKRAGDGLGLHIIDKELQG